MLSILFGFFFSSLPELGGVIGFEMNMFFQDYIGKIGTLLILLFSTAIFLIFKIKISPDAIKTFLKIELLKQRASQTNRLMQWPNMEMPTT